jgi:hypothetical protein
VEKDQMWECPQAGQEIMKDGIETAISTGQEEIEIKMKD